MAAVSRRGKRAVSPPDDRVAAPGTQTASAGTPHNQGGQGTCVVYALVAVIAQILVRKYNIVLDEINAINTIKRAARALAGARVVDVINALHGLGGEQNLDTDGNAEVLQLQIDHGGLAEDFDALCTHVDAHQGRGSRAVVLIATEAAGHGRHAVAAEGVTELAGGSKTVQCLNSWGADTPYWDVVLGGGPANERAPYLSHVLINDVSIVRMRRYQDGKLSEVPVPGALARHAAPVPRLREEAEAARAELAASQREVARRMEAQRLAEQATVAVRAELAASQREVAQRESILAASRQAEQQAAQGERRAQEQVAQLEGESARVRAAHEAQRRSHVAELDHVRQYRTFSLAGHPTAAYNGRYMVDSMHEGWPVLKNADGMYCYRHTATGSWYLNDAFTPDSHNCCTYITNEDPLPVGAHTWHNWVDDEWVKQELTTTVTEVLATELRLRAECWTAKRGAAAHKRGAAARRASEQAMAEAETALQQARAEAEATLQAQLAETDAKAALREAEQGKQAAEQAKAEAEAALQQAEQERTHPFSLTGHAFAAYNGRYTVDMVHGEWPVLKNANNKYCFYHAASGKWFLNDEFTPDSDMYYTCIESEGALPVGTHTWQSWVDDQGVEHQYELTTTVTDCFATALWLRAECLAAKQEAKQEVAARPTSEQARADAEAALQQMAAPSEGLPPGPGAPSPVSTQPPSSHQRRPPSPEKPPKGGGGGRPELELEPQPEQFVPLTEQLAQQGTIVRLAADHAKVGTISHRTQRRIKVQFDDAMDWAPPSALAGWKNIVAVANLLEAQAV